MSDVISPERLMLAANFCWMGHGRWGRTIHFQGPPGGGKTQRTRQFGRSWGFPVFTVIASIREPTDFLGQNVPQLRWEELKGRMVFMVDGLKREPERWARELLDCERAILLLDEASTIVMVTQHAMLRVVEERVVGDTELPPGIRIMLLSNPAAMVGGWETNPALANRQTWLSWPKAGLGNMEEVDGWCNWMLTDGGENGHLIAVQDAGAEEKRVSGLWPVENALTTGKLTGFIQKFPDLLEVDFPEDGKPVRGWPTKRAWEAFGRLYTSSRIQGLSELEADVLLEGTVGEAAAQQFRGWEVENGVNPLDVLDGKAELEVSISRPDLAAAAFYGMAGLLNVKTLPNRIARATKFWTVAKKAIEVLPDTVKPASDIVAVQAGLGMAQFPNPKGDCIQVLAKLQELNDAA